MDKLLSLSKNNIIRYLSIIIAILTAYLIIPNKGFYFPYAGITVSFLVLATFIYFFISEKKWFNTFIFITTLITSLYISVFHNPYVLVLNIFSTIFFISIIGLKELTLLNVVIAPFKSLDDSIKTGNIYPFDKPRGQKISFPEYTLSSIVTSLILLIIIIPLLSSTNPIFKNYVDSFLNFINLKEVISWILKTNLTVIFARLIIFVAFTFLLPKYLSAINSKLAKKQTPSSFSTFLKGLILPKIVVIVVLAIFFVTQIQLYFASAERLVELGYTNSTQTREIFAQLAIVAVIVFLLIYNDRVKDIKNKISTYVLIAQGSFLAIMAFYSDFTYISNFGFTHKRLYGLAFVFWISAIFILFFYKYLKQKSVEFFIRLFLVCTGLVIVSINFANFDKLIYNNPPIVNNSIDYSYLAQIVDAPNYEDLILKIEKEVKNNRNFFDARESKSNNDIRERILDSSRQISYVADSLSQKYFPKDDEPLDWRNYNLSEYKLAKRVQGSKLKKINETNKYIDYMIVLNYETEYAKINKVSPAKKEILIKFINLPEGINGEYAFKSVKTNKVIQEGNFIKFGKIPITIEPGEYEITLMDTYKSGNNYETIRHPFKTKRFTFSERMVSQDEVILDFKD